MAVCSARLVIMLPVVLHFPVAGTGEAFVGEEPFVGEAAGVAVAIADAVVGDGLEGCPLDDAGGLPAQADMARAMPAISAMIV